MRSQAVRLWHGVCAAAARSPLGERSALSEITPRRASLAQPSPIHFKNLEKAEPVSGVLPLGTGGRGGGPATGRAGDGAGGTGVAGFVASILCKIAWFRDFEAAAPEPTPTPLRPVA